MLYTIFRILALFNKAHECMMLQMFCIINILLQLLLTGFEDITYYRC